MSDQPDELRICPNCGQANALYTLRCIRCGEELEGLFELEGFESLSEPAGKEPEEDLAPMADILASLDESPLLADDKKPEEESLEKAGETEEGQPEDGKDDPDWLERIRQRAKEEEDAAGVLAKGGLAMDDRRSHEGRKQVDEAFDEIMRRIREQNDREKARRSRRVESDLVDENGDPEWLRRIRELHPNREDSPNEIQTDASTTDSLDDEWTEEELQELLRREIGLPETPDEEAEETITQEVPTPPLPTDEPEPSLSEPIAENFEEEVLQAEPDPEDFHNIPEDDDQTLKNELEDEMPSDEVEGTFPADENQTEAALQPDLEESTEPDETLVYEKDSEPVEELDSEVDSKPEDKAVEIIESETQDSSDVEDEIEDVSKKSQPAEEPLSTEEVSPDLLLLRDQRDRASVFTDIIGQEGRRTIAVLREHHHQSKIGRLVLGLLLILGVILAILLGPPGSVDLPSPAAGMSFAENLDSIDQDDAVLVVLNYQAASRSNIEPLAARTMEILEEKGALLHWVTSNPENLWLDPLQVPDDFIPGGMLGYLALATGSSSRWGEMPIQQALNGDLDFFGEVDQVILISDSAEFVRMWLEQISPWQPRIKTSAITTPVSGPILLPYYDSGQLQGFVAGIADASVLNVEPQNLVNQRAYQIGMLLMIVILLLGMITKADEDSQRRAEEQNR